ncbi:hypothetical protein [Actinoplanes sp. NPDC051411]|uniref:hypothetical protein n=1 Tax=Actinoplanes sp. NPDC051411 TaxID=3155522 RepID=UPI003412CFFA
MLARSLVPRPAERRTRGRLARGIAGRRLARTLTALHRPGAHGTGAGLIRTGLIRTGLIRTGLIRARLIRTELARTLAGGAPAGRLATARPLTAALPARAVGHGPGPTRYGRRANALPPRHHRRHHRGGRPRGRARPTTEALGAGTVLRRNTTTALATGRSEVRRAAVGPARSEAARGLVTVAVAAATTASARAPPVIGGAVPSGALTVGDAVPPRVLVPGARPAEAPGTTGHRPGAARHSDARPARQRTGNVSRQISATAARHRTGAGLAARSGTCATRHGPGAATRHVAERARPSRRPGSRALRPRAAALLGCPEAIAPASGATGRNRP